MLIYMCVCVCEYDTTTAFYLIKLLTTTIYDIAKRLSLCAAYK